MTPSETAATDIRRIRQRGADREPEPVPLPMAAGQPRERGDAAANRERILCAARRLVTEEGSAALTMDAVAAEAGVGKGTVFRRFRDRAGLTEALIDEYMRRFQDAFLHGPPPLGPGAPPAERLEAFVLELIRLQMAHLDPALAAEVPARNAQPQAIGALIVHVESLVRELGPGLDERVVAGLLLSALAPSVLDRLRRETGADEHRLAEGALALLRGLTGRVSMPRSITPATTPAATTGGPGRR